jgi:regulator of protease activity HflC (stomatin/prohibitin superfamily)
MAPSPADPATAVVDPDATGLTAAFADAGGTTRKLVQVAAIQAALLMFLAAAAVLTQLRPGRSPSLDAVLREGAPGVVGAGLLISLTGTLTCLLIAWGRGHSFPVRPARARLAMVTRLAGWPQAVLVLTGAAAAVLTLRWLPPSPPDPAAALPAWSAIAGLMVLPAFLLLVCERIVAAIPPGRLPEAHRLAALLRIPAFVVLLLAGLFGAAGLGFTAGRWPVQALGVLLMLVAGELALRTLAVWFLPLPAPTAARAAIGSLLAALLQPGTLRPAEMARRMRTQFGIDIGRSWAVTYVRAAAAPVLLGLLVLFWGLSGVARIGLAERGSYERFGAPVAVLRPGLHLLLPWPFGRVRRVEFGVVHAISVGAEPGSTPPGSTGAQADVSTADGPAPLTANRLWDQQSGSEISYLIASRSPGPNSSATRRESFETVSVDIRVLYRIGLDDQSARRALYGLAEPDTLVRSLSDRLLAQFFATRTLADVLGARREQVATRLRDALQAELDDRRSGVEVLALVVESMHPPGGAAAAYRSVQAAEITASTRRAQEIGRAHGTLSVAARDAHDVDAQAHASAAELLSAAQSERWQSDADLLAYRDGGRAFLLERYFSNLRTALGVAALEVVDHRLGRPDMPVIDLRAPADIVADAGRGAALPPGSR